MTVEKCLALARALNDNAFPDEVLLQWLNEVEGRVQTDIMRIAPDDAVSYDEEDAEVGAGAELMVKAPHDKLYPAYLVALTDFHNGEFDRYANTFQMFNAHWAEYANWYIRHVRACAEPEYGFYISAYGLAVKHPHSRPPPPRRRRSCRPRRRFRPLRRRRRLHWFRPLRSGSRPTPLPCPYEGTESGFYADLAAMEGLSESLGTIATALEGLL